MNFHKSQPSPKHKMFAIYHHHEYGSSQYLLWSKIQRLAVELLRDIRDGTKILMDYYKMEEDD